MSLEINSQSTHSILLEDRQKVFISGVSAVKNYNEFEATIETALGTLVLGGKALKVSELSVGTGQIRVEGDIEYLQYIKSKPEKKTLKGIFR